MEEQDRKAAAGGFAAVFDWAIEQDFEPDHAERMRREAWATRARLATFEEDWDAPGMDAYDAL